MESDPEKPPFFKSWNGMYGLVLATLALLLIFFSILTKAYE
jgi:hypothetical protein